MAPEHEGGNRSDSFLPHYAGWNQSREVPGKKDTMFHPKSSSVALAGGVRSSAATDLVRQSQTGTDCPGAKEFTAYGKEFYLGQKGLSYRSARQTVPIVQQFLPIRSVCDLGCGVGTWLRAFREAGVQDMIGFDGEYVDKLLLEIPRSVFREADLRQRLRLDRTFDLAISMEVAEHLPESRAVSFVEDLTRLAPVVLFSAAIPRQGGRSHINEQWQSYWAALFADNDFVTCDVLRPLIWENREIARWYRQNIFLFCRRDFLLQVPRLTPTHDNSLPLAVVHPEEYLEKWDGISVRSSLKLLDGALKRALRRRLEKLLRNNLRPAPGTRVDQNRDENAGD